MTLLILFSGWGEPAPVVPSAAGVVTISDAASIYAMSMSDAPVYGLGMGDAEVYGLSVGDSAAGST